MSLEGRIFAIGDVHGCLRELELLLDRLQLQPEDRLIFLGDLVNRGPDSAGVVRLVRKLRNKRCLLGNHERRLLQYHRDGDPSILRDYDWPTLRALNDEDWEFLDILDVLLEMPREQTLFVHAGLLPWQPWREQTADILCHIQVIDPQSGTWGKRSELIGGVSWQNLWEGPPFIICGHTPRPEVFRRPWSICLDTGCADGGKLTACEVHTLELIQIPARENYTGRVIPDE